jgi:hypothetical protein
MVTITLIFRRIELHPYMQLKASTILAEAMAETP